MRHFLLPGPVSTLAFSVGMTPSMRGLIAPAGGSYQQAAGLWRASLCAVVVAAIAVAADKHSGAAAGA
jgi:hypothetical protein